MKLANLVTSSRIFLSPLFFLVFFIPEWTGAGNFISVFILWILFILIEISDLFDGMVARARNEVSDLGKLLDPFADSFSRLTYFLCFIGIGVMPVWVFLLVLYRDLSVSFIRLLMAKKGIAMSARISGKIKAFIYAFAGIAGLAVVTFQRIPELGKYSEPVETVGMVTFIMAAATAVWTLIDYLRALRPSDRS